MEWLSISNYIWPFVCLLFNAMIQVMTTRRTPKKREEAAVPQPTRLEEQSTVDRKTLAQAESSAAVCRRISEAERRVLAREEKEDTDELDGDEPEIFFALLKQTGTEMMNVSRLCIVRQFVCYVLGN